ncbi:MAG: class II aldolase/adducin family protein [Bacteroidota bacterium]
MDEGYIKYQCHWQLTPALPSAYIDGLNKTRRELVLRNWVGVYPESGIGYGNLSSRHPEKPGCFIISGTQTGGIKQLTGYHYAIVTAWNLDKNVVHCKGPLKASSEALTHAGIYALSPEIMSVIHIHHKGLWEKWKNILPTTPESVGYGSVEMAKWMKILYQNSDLRNVRALVMGGHEEGLIGFGKTNEEALQNLVKIHEK